MNLRTAGFVPLDLTPDQLAKQQGTVKIPLPDQTVFMLASSDLAGITETFLEAPDITFTLGFRYPWIVASLVFDETSMGPIIDLIADNPDIGLPVLLAGYGLLMGYSFYRAHKAYKEKKAAYQENEDIYSKTTYSKMIRRMLGGPQEIDEQEVESKDPAADEIILNTDESIRKLNAAFQKYKDPKYQSVEIVKSYSGEESKQLPTYSMRVTFNPPPKKGHSSQRENKQGSLSAPLLSSGNHSDEEKISDTNLFKKSSGEKWVNKFSTFWNGLSLVSFGYWILWIAAAAVVAAVDPVSGIGGLHDALAFGLPALVGGGYIGFKVRNYYKNGGGKHSSVYADLSNTAQKDMVNLFDTVRNELGYQDEKEKLEKSIQAKNPSFVKPQNIEEKKEEKELVAKIAPPMTGTTIFTTFVAKFGGAQYVLWYTGDLIHRMFGLLLGVPVIGEILGGVALAATLGYAAYKAYEEREAYLKAKQAQKESSENQVRSLLELEELHLKKCRELSQLMKQPEIDVSKSFVLTRGKAALVEWKKPTNHFKETLEKGRVGANVLMTGVFFARMFIIPGTVSFLSKYITINYALASFVAISNPYLLGFVILMGIAYGALKIYQDTQKANEKKSKTLISEIKKRDEEIKIARLTIENHDGPSALYQRTTSSDLVVRNDNDTKMDSSPTVIVSPNQAPSPTSEPTSTSVSLPIAANTQPTQERQSIVPEIDFLTGTPVVSSIPPVIVVNKEKDKEKGSNVVDFGSPRLPEVSPPPEFNDGRGRRTISERDGTRTISQQYADLRTRSKQNPVSGNSLFTLLPDSALGQPLKQQDTVDGFFVSKGGNDKQVFVNPKDTPNTVRANVLGSVPG